MCITDSINNNKRTFIAAPNDAAFSPRVGIVYQPLKTISLFTGYSNSFTPNTGKDIYLLPLKPSFITQYEAGVKTKLFHKILAANITVYQIINSNLAQIALKDAYGNANNNSNMRKLAGEVTGKGVEIDLFYQTDLWVTGNSGFSHNQTKYSKSNTYIKGSKLRYNPENTANASLYYSFSSRTAPKSFNIGVGSYYVGKKVAGRSTRTQVVNDTNKLMTIPDYIQLDASAGYSFKKNKYSR